MNRHRQPTPERIIVDGYQAALNVLRRCAHTLGLQASANSSLYRKVWARDSMVCLFGAAAFKDPILTRAFQHSLQTLERYQTKDGVIPNYVDTQTKQATYRAYADGGAWFVIGCAQLYRATKDKAFARARLPALRRVLAWYATQSPDQTGFITMDEAADWEDIFGVRGKGLTVNILYTWALREAAWLESKLGKKSLANVYAERSRILVAKIRDRFWYTPQRNVFHIIQDSFGMKTRARRQQIAAHGRWAFIQDRAFMSRNSFFLPYITFLRFGEWFDSLGNLLAILTGVATQAQACTIIKTLQRNHLHKPWPVKATWPPRRPGMKDWQHYYVLKKLNLLNQYHNGGAWPYLGGIYVAALAKAGQKQEARRALLRLAKMNQQGKAGSWEFSEWFHGRTGKPMGMPSQAWSAGMYLLAYRSIKR